MQNKYRVWYYNIINTALSESRVYNSIQYENHHILPKSMGGNNTLNNIAILTFREHFICHRLLVKFLKGRDKAKMIAALMTFFHFDYTNRKRAEQRGKCYSIHKRLYVEALRDKTPLPIRQDILSFKHKISGDEFVGNIFDFKKYSGLTAQDVNMLINGYNMHHIKQWGVYDHNLEVYSYNRSRTKPKPQPKIICPHCLKETSPTNFKRWHGDKCVNINPEYRKEATRQISQLHSFRS